MVIQKGTKKMHDPRGQRDAWLIVIAAFLIAFGVVFSAQRNFLAELSVANNKVSSLSIPKDLRVWIEFDSGNKKRIFEGGVAEPPQSLDKALFALARDAKLAFQTKNGALVEFDGTKNSTRTWKLYKNGEPLSGELSQITINRSDRYTFLYER